MKKLGDVLPENVLRAMSQINPDEWEPLNLEPVYNCQTCHDRHYVSYDVQYGDERFGKLFPCPDCAGGQALYERRWKSRLLGAELPTEYQSLTFESWLSLPPEMQQGKMLALACAQLFVQSPDRSVSLQTAFQLAGRQLDVDIVRKSLIFQGLPGIGKTGLAAAIVNELLAQNQSVLYIRTQDFIESVKDSFKGSRKDGDDTQSIIDVVKTAPTLILDEFNVTIDGEWRQEIIENVIRYRYGNSLPTVLTCNATRTELEHQWGIRTTNVLFAMAHWIPMGGESLRDLRQYEQEGF